MVMKPFFDLPIDILVWSYIIIFWLAWAYFCTWLTSNFHKTKYHGKIQNLLFFWYIFEVLSGRPWTEIRDLVTKASVWNMKRSVTKGLYSKIRTESEARIAAKQLFETVTKTGSQFIEFEDLARFLPEYDVVDFLSYLSGTSEVHATQISCSALQHFMVYAFRLEKSVVWSMKDTDSIISRLRIQLYMAAAITQTIAAVPALLGLEGIRLTLYSFLLLLVFLPIKICIEATSFFESLRFIFIHLPYDVGERCEIDKVELVVKKINFTSTTFVGLDNKEYQMSSRRLLPKCFRTFLGSSQLEKIGLIMSSRFEEDDKDASSSG